MTTPSEIERALVTILTAPEDARRALAARLGGGQDGEVEAVDEYAAKVARSLSVPKYAERVNMCERRIWAWISSNPPKIVSFKTHGGRRLIDPEDNPVQKISV